MLQGRNSVRHGKECSFLLMLKVPDSHAYSVAVVWFSSVQGPISPNLEPDYRSSSGKSLNLNLNLNLPEQFFRSSSGFREVLNPNWTNIQIVSGTHFCE